MKICLVWFALTLSFAAYSQMDMTPPAIHSISFQNSVWRAGSRQKVFIRVSDQASGVSENTPNFLMFVPLTGERPAPEVVKPDSVSRLHHERGDLFSFEFTVNRWIPPGSYALSSVNVYDRAGNSEQIYIGKNSQVYTQPDGGDEIPVIHAEIQNPGPVDVTPPRLLDIYADTPVWKAGSVHKIYFRLSDDVSGVETGYVFYNAMTSLFEKNGHRIGVYPFREMIDEGNGVYSAECTISPYLASGDYIFPYFIIEDRARNMLVIEKQKDDNLHYHVETYTTHETATEIPLLKVHVENDAIEDFTPPQILEWKVRSSNWKIGQPQRFYFRATDDISKFKEGHVSISFFSTRLPSDSPTSVISQYFKFAKGEVRSEGGDWYSVQLKPGRYISEGSYWLGSFDLQDTAGNEVGVNCIRHGSCVIEGAKEIPIDLPQLQISVSR